MVLVEKWPVFQKGLKQFRPGKCVLRYSLMKKRLSTLLKQEVQKLEKLIFFPWG